MKKAEAENAVRQLILKACQNKQKSVLIYSVLAKKVEAAKHLTQKSAA